MGEKEPRCFATIWLLRDETDRVHTSDPHEARTDCGMVVGPDWRRLAKGTPLGAITCPVCLRHLAEDWSASYFNGTRFPTSS
jgi:hypothetical protein